MNRIFCIIISFLCFGIKAQTQLFTVEDGLSSHDITCLLQTHNGYLWVGTANGLNLFDGYTFYEFNRHNGLTNGKIKCLFEDKKGLLWIGTWEGLNILNQETGEIKHYFQLEGKKGTVLNSEITCIESSVDGSMLVSVGNGTVMKFSDENTFTKIYTLLNPENIIKYQITKIKSLEDSSFFVLNNYGLIKRLTKDFKEDQNFSKEHELIMDITVMENKKELLLMDIWGKTIWISGKTGKKFKELKSPKSFVQYRPLMASFVSGSSSMWTGFSYGDLFFTNLTTGFSTNYTSESKHFITGSPTCIYPDRNGVVWIGSNYGLVKFCPKKHNFEDHLVSLNDDYGSKNSIRGMIEDKKGDIYIGSYNGLFRMRGDSIQHIYLGQYDAVDATTAFYPYRLLDDGNYIWITTETRGFYKFNKLTNTIEFPLPSLDFFKGYSILKENADTLWLGTHHGLFIYDITRNKLSKYNKSQDLFDISGTEIMELVHDSDGNIWIGTYSSGIFKKEKNGAIVKHLSNANTSYALNFITTLFFENDSILWVGTRGAGIGRINIRTDKINFYTKQQGLADNSIAGIIKDNTGIFWISTFNGLSRFDFKTGAFENYYDKDGLSDNEFNTLAYLKTRTGKIYMGGLNGINAFYPGKLHKNGKQQPHIFLTHFAKYDGSTNSLVEQSLDLSGLKKIHLTHQDKFFSFSFALDDYYGPLRNTFFYKLEGYETVWNNLGTLHSIRFNSLPPGNYNLRIKGVNSDGIGSANELMIAVLVSPAFYNTWWFYSLTLLVVIALVYSITRYRIYQGLKIRNLRTKISSDLHDEVGSLLTRISIQAELIKQGISPNDTAHEVGRIADTSRLATAAMSDVLWSIDARNDKMGNLIDRLREQAGEILFPLEIDVDFVVRGIDLSREIDSRVRQNLFLIFKESVNNIARHSRASQVNILLENRQNQFVMVIEDNGMEEKKDKILKQGQGLRNMKMRAELLDGTLEIDNSNGYKIILKLRKFA